MTVARGTRRRDGRIRGKEGDHAHNNASTTTYQPPTTGMENGGGRRGETNNKHQDAGIL